MLETSIFAINQREVMELEEAFKMKIEKRMTKLITTMCALYSISRLVLSFYILALVLNDYIESTNYKKFLGYLINVCYLIVSLVGVGIFFFLIKFKKQFRDIFFSIVYNSIYNITEI